MATKPIAEVGKQLKEYVPDLTETELAKKVSKTVSEAESKILENTNIYQYGGFKSKQEREKLKSTLEVPETNNSNNSSETLDANPDAGNALVPTKQSKISQILSNLMENNVIIKSKPREKVFYLFIFS